VTELGAQAVRAAKDPPVDHHAAAHAGSEGEHHQVSGGCVVHQLGLGEGGAVGVVVHEHGHAEALLELFAQRDAGQGDVYAREHGAGGEIDLRRHAHAHGGRPLGRLVGDLVEGVLDAVEQALGAVEDGGLLRHVLDLRAVHSRGGDLGPAHVNANHHWSGHSRILFPEPAAVQPGSPWRARAGWRRMPPVRGGLDLGGTKIQAVICDDQHRVLGQSRRETPQQGGPADVVEGLAETLGDAAADAGIQLSGLDGVGVGSPGAVDAQAGTVGEASNLPGFGDPFPLAGALADRLGTRVMLGNDVSAGVGAEFELGAARDAHSLLGVFWGTGVGGGIVLDGKPWVGRGAAGEIGHVVVKRGGARCPCGRRGCMEAYAGRRAMERRARQLVKRGEQTALFRIMEERGRDRLASGVWARALKQRDPMAIALVDRAVKALGAGIASSINLLDVGTVVIGGGLGTRLGEPYVRRIEAAMQPHLFVDDRPPEVKLAALGDLGGAIGATLLLDQAAAAPVGA
jgi:glucokinase